MNRPSKKERLQLLRKLINDKEISDQTQLQKELRAQGIDTTQATISRDLQELKVVKIRVKPGLYKYKIFEVSSPGHLADQLKVLFENFVYTFRGTGNLMVIKTTSGNANSVAIVLDQLNYPEIFGTIAGDDTILVIFAGNQEREKMEQEFQPLGTLSQ